MIDKSALFLAIFGEAISDEFQAKGLEILSDPSCHEIEEDQELKRPPLGTVWNYEPVISGGESYPHSASPPEITGS